MNHLPSQAVVDADLHGHENVAAMADFCVEPWSIALRNIAQLPDRATDLPGIAPKADFNLPFPGGVNRTKKTDNAPQMVAEMDDLGISVGVLFPDYLLSIPVIERPDFAVAVASAYNEWLVNTWLADTDRIRGAILVAPQNPAKAAAEIRRHAGSERFAAVCIATCGLRPLLGHESYDPIYEAAAEADLPIVLHAITMVHPTFPFQLDVFESGFMKHAFSHALSILANVSSMIETGLPERFPSLRIGALEAGVAWILFAMKRLNREYLERRRQVPRLQDLPSRYLCRMFFGTQPLDVADGPGFAALNAACGGDLRLMYASDWPHHDFDHPNAIRKLRLSEEAERKVLSENARELFRGL